MLLTIFGDKLSCSTNSGNDIKMKIKNGFHKMLVTSSEVDKSKQFKWHVYILISGSQKVLSEACKTFVPLFSSGFHFA